MSQIQTLYKSHFGMTARPFSGLADAAVLHWGRAHKRAQAALEYGLISGAPFSVLTGVAGSGKTSLLLNLMATAQDDMRLAMVIGLRRGGGSVLPWILQALGEDVPDDASETKIHSIIQNLMIAEYAAGRRIVLIFDEAHNMSPDALDELRVLSNINTAQDQLVQIVLAGLPKLRERLQDPDMAGLAQRVASWGHIETLDRETLTDYVGTRLAHASAPTDMFTPDALDLVFESTAGLPRPINQLCELAIVYTMTSDRKVIDAEAVRQVLDDGLYMRPVTAKVSYTHLSLRTRGDAHDG